MAEKTQIIPRHLIENREEYRRLIDQYFACVSRKTVNQMRRGLDEPLNQLWTGILGPSLLLTTQGERREWINLTGVDQRSREQRPIYFPISDTKKTWGKNHNLAAEAFTRDRDWGQGQASVFANPLRIGCQRNGKWGAPKLRVAGAPYTIFTLEYDAPSEWDRERRLRFLDTQFGWFRKGSNDLDRAIRPVWDWAAQFSDFRGMCACWSGHKSVHIHLIFDTSAMMSEFADLRDRVRPALQRLWDDMASEIARVFPQEIEPDRALRQPDQYRKLPNGVYTIEPPKDPEGHLLGIPVGTRVPLLCLWEKLLERAPVGADRAFVNEGVLKQSAATDRPSPDRYRRKSHIGNMTAGEHEFCSERFSALVASRVAPHEFPKGAGLFKETSGWIGRLYANEFDRNPSTIIFEDNIDVFVQGGRQPARVFRLPMPLGLLIRKWQREHARQHGTPVEAAALARTEIPVEVPPQRPEEEEFSKAATSPEAARRALGMLLPDLLKRYEQITLRAPEGLGKTTGIIMCLPDLTDYLTLAALESIPLDERLRRDVEWRRPSAFAFSSYELAKEKAKECNESASGKTHMGIVFPSFSRLYKDSCEALDIEPLATLNWAAEHDYKSVVDAIRSGQSEVWEEMAARHEGLFKSDLMFGGRPKRVVYFLVHQVLQQVTTNILSAAFLHPWFFSTEPKDWWRLAEETRFQVAVHDEVPKEAIVTMHPAALVEWCFDLFKTVPEVWNDEKAGLAEKHRTFGAKRSNAPIQIEFGTVLEIQRAGYRETDQTEVAGCESYGDGLIYVGTHGHRWYARKRSWWNGLADRTILLTTEALPTEMLRALDPEQGQFEVFDLRTPKLRSGEIQVCLWPSCSSENAEDIAKQALGELGDPNSHVITNRAGGMDRTSTHAGVRGSNRLTGTDVAQTAFYKSPPEYEQLQVINRLFHLTGAIRLRHVDEINQSAGRNLGFRHDGEVQHRLYIGWSLYGEIESVLYAESRYGLTLVEDAEQRKQDKFGKKRKALRSLAQQDAETDGLIDEPTDTAWANIDAELDAMADEHDDQEWLENAARDCMTPALAHPDAEFNAMAEEDDQEQFDIPCGSGSADSAQTDLPGRGLMVTPKGARV